MSGNTKVKWCTKCGGYLVSDEGDWRCWQCGQYYYDNPSTTTEELYPQLLDGQAPSGPQDSPYAHSTGSENGETGQLKKRRRGYGARSARNIDSVIRAKKTSDERWWARNQQIIEYLDRGLTVRETAQLAGRGERQIRVVRERLTDLRAANGDEPQAGG